MHTLKRWLAWTVCVLLLAACSAPQATALPATIAVTQPPATQPPATATTAPTATATTAASPTPANTPTTAPTATEAVQANACIECHTDKDQLIQTAKVEEEKPKESEGAG